MTCPDLNKHFEESCKLLRFDANKLFKIRKLFANFCTSFVWVYTNPVYYTSIHKDSLLYKCTKNQFTVQVYTKPVYQVYTNLGTNKWNVHTWTEHYYRMYRDCLSCLCLSLLTSSCFLLFLPLPASTWLHLLLPASACLCLPKNSILGTHRQTHLTFALLELLLETT